jgi:hypothetical protein
MQQQGTALSQTFQLSAAGLKRAASVEEHSFEIIIANKSFFVPRFQAAFISLQIHQLLISDSTINKFVVDGISSDNFSESDVPKLIEGDIITMNESSESMLRIVGKSLLNPEIMIRIVTNALSKEELMISTAVSRLHLKNEYSICDDEEIEFIASHMSSISDLSEVGVDNLEQILNHPKLLIRSEDWLFDFITGLGTDYCVLFQYVLWKYLSCEYVEKMISNILISDLDTVTWNCICDRLRCEIIIDELSSRYESYPGISTGAIETVHIDSNSPLNGIISRLCRECGGQVYDKGVMTITSSGDSNYRCLYVTHDNSSSSFCTLNVPHSWLCLDFHEKRVSLSGYTIKSDNNSCHLMTWVIEGSNEGSKWILIDEVKNSQELIESFRVHTFEIAKSSRFYRWIRLRQTGKNSSGNDQLAMCSIELFGQIHRPNNLNG